MEEKGRRGEGGGEEGREWRGGREMGVSKDDG